jgi:hypothetical protein
MTNGNGAVTPKTLAEAAAKRQDASSDVAAAFANAESSKRKLVARAAGVDPLLASELGY